MNLPGIYGIDIFNGYGRAHDEYQKSIKAEIFWYLRLSFAFTQKEKNQADSEVKEAPRNRVPQNACRKI